MEFVDYEKKFDTKDIQGVIERFSAGSLNDGEKIQVQGVIHRIRHMSGFAFVIIRSPRILFQCVWEENTSQVEYGMPPHGGFGLGLERIVQRLVGFENIREATAFPRDRERLRP